MEKTSTKERLSKSWASFVEIIFDPWVLSLLVITGLSFWCLTYYSNQTNKSSVILTVLSTITTVVSALAGGVAAAKWAKATEMSVLNEKGKSAIRGLKLILLNVSKIEKRTAVYINKIEKSNPQYQLIENNFEEIVEKCNIVQEEIISSIENWTDILPNEADIKTQIGIISELKTDKENKEQELNALKEKLNTVEVNNVTEREKLELQIQEKSREISNKNARIAQLEYTSQLTGLSQSVHNGRITIGGGYDSIFQNRDSFDDALKIARSKK